MLFRKHVHHNLLYVKRAKTESIPIVSIQMILRLSQSELGKKLCIVSWVPTCTKKHLDGFLTKHWQKMLQPL